ncbi:hypothetical protein CROQUDRAFT_529080 [Cronartium quercuum f. sp. fusiforme G11]|uniref:Uncharacterized protein n=1 Tax=Cronartium quercuum f. sp. fusiforme G11 TaxID=708437 RepID=A0A9P6TBI5_9BASI|nr:hypothetical protein CROQUDRAFT_529080 [Cronartium quercuum f. sp. fusiforme G11]
MSAVLPSWLNDWVSLVPPKLAEPPTEPSAPRQAALDDAVQRKLKSDLKNLKELEAEVESKVFQAFRQQTTSSDKTQADGTPSSSQLMEELSSIKQRSEQFKTRNTSGMWPEISAARTAIVSCLSDHKHQPLKCGEEVDNFKQLVQKLEKEYVGSLQ